MLQQHQVIRLEYIYCKTNLICFELQLLYLYNVQLADYSNRRDKFVL